MILKTIQTPSLYKGLIHGALKLAEAGKATPPCIRKVYIPEIKSIDEENRIIEHYASSDNEDRDNDIIEQMGWNYEQYDENPVVLEGHRYDLRPIANNISHEIETIDGSKFLRVKTKYPDVGIKASSDEDFRLRQAGFLKTWSVGFRPIEWAWRQEVFGIRFIEQWLLEYSSVSIPANTDAMDLGLGEDGAMKALFGYLYPGQKFERPLFEKVMEEAGKQELKLRQLGISGSETLKQISEAADSMKGFVLQSAFAKMENAWCPPSTPDVQPQDAGAKNNNRNN